MNDNLKPVRDFTDNEDILSLFYQPFARSHASGWWSNIDTGEPIEIIQDVIDEKEVLIISELSEALEAARKSLMDDKLPHRDGVEVELADTVIRCLDLFCAIGAKLNDKNKEILLGDEFSIGKTTFAKMKKYCCMDLFSDWLKGSQYLIVVKYCMEYCLHNNLDLISAMVEKMEYNAQREDHKIENRKKSGGKKF